MRSVNQYYLKAIVEQLKLLQAKIELDIKRIECDRHLPPKVGEHWLVSYGRQPLVVRIDSRHRRPWVTVIEPNSRLYGKRIKVRAFIERIQPDTDG
jgi:hypothetical protein